MDLAFGPDPGRIQSGAGYSHVLVPVPVSNWGDPRHIPPVLAVQVFHYTCLQRLQQMPKELSQQCPTGRLELHKLWRLQAYLPERCNSSWLKRGLKYSLDTDPAVIAW